MIRVPLQMKQHEVAESMITVPRMVRLATFQFAVVASLAEQPIVFDIVCTGELPVGEQVVEYQEWNDYDAECNDQNKTEKRGQRIGLQYLIIRMPN